MKFNIKYITTDAGSLLNNYAGTESFGDRMKFISYAQNFEDVMLWRALRRFGPGFYLDIGACDPEVDSVTKAFYDEGWSGINVEPMKSAFDRIQFARPRDVNLNCAIDETSWSREIYSVDDGNGLSTFDHELAKKYRNEGRSVEETDVNAVTLAEVCDIYVKGDIHFLKIDVEGGEEAVLKGADFKKFRPWIILVEATIPNSTELSHYSWDHILVDAGYSFIYFDGLNRFYIATEKFLLLSEYFKSPPNVFDNFIRNDHLKANAEAEEKGRVLSELGAMLPESAEHDGGLSERIQELAAALSRAQTEIRYCHQELFESSRAIGALSKERNNLVNRAGELAQNMQLEAQNMQLEIARRDDRIASLLGSRSWKITAPLRRLVLLFRR